MKSRRNRETGGAEGPTEGQGTLKGTCDDPMARTPLPNCVKIRLSDEIAAELEAAADDAELPVAVLARVLVRDALRTRRSAAAAAA